MSCQFAHLSQSPGLLAILEYERGEIADSLAGAAFTLGVWLYDRLEAAVRPPCVEWYYGATTLKHLSNLVPSECQKDFNSTRVGLNRLHLMASSEATCGVASSEFDRC